MEERKLLNKIIKKFLEVTLKETDEINFKFKH